METSRRRIKSSFWMENWQADKEKCQERLATIASDKQNLEAEIEEIKSNKNAIQERYQNLQEEVAQARLLKTELQGQKTLRSCGY